MSNAKENNRNIDLWVKKRGTQKERTFRRTKSHDWSGVRTHESGDIGS